MSREQHKIEAALKDPEMSSRYRFMDINEHGGVLKVLSYLDQFSQSIAVPEIKVTAADLGLPDGLQKSTLERKRILVLDDTEINRAAAQYQFGEKNQVDIFSTYKAAAEALRHSQYDYVLLDLLMEPESFMLSDSAFARVAGSEFAAGSIVALVAATKPNTHVIVASDASHHDHPATALLDYLWNSRIVMENGSSLIFRQASTVKNTLGGMYVKDWVAATGS
jgi:CheY-like chemotaxis protein